MKKLITAACLSVAALGLGSGQASAGLLGCCWKHCCYKYSICCRPYNAFTPCCFGNLYCDGCCCPPYCCPPSLHFNGFPNGYAFGSDACCLGHLPPVNGMANGYPGQSGGVVPPGPGGDAASPPNAAPAAPPGQPAAQPGFTPSPKPLENSRPPSGPTASSSGYPPSYAPGYNPYAAYRAAYYPYNPYTAYNAYAAAYYARYAPQMLMGGMPMGGMPMGPLGWNGAMNAGR